ncbi:MAG: METTL5 family protein [Methanomassiliicoccales archaeon]
MKKKELEMLVQRVPPIRDPQPGLEQYSTPADIASDVLFTAYWRGDIADRRVMELGCGNGMFAIGASLLGAETSLGVDIDPGCLEQARENSLALGARVELVRARAEDLEARVDTVIQNPPFGAQRKGADRPFLRTALRCADRVYTLHLAGTEPFLLEYIDELGGEVESRRRYKFNIPHLFGFHRKEVKSVEVVMLIVATGE